MDANSGKIIGEVNADTAHAPASLTKMMTLYIVFDMLQSGRLKLDTPLTISRAAANQQPSKLGLGVGEQILVRDAIKALVTKSANDVAMAIAENLAGNEQKFARYMTVRAHQLGMKHTTFKNASGLPNSEQMTTARDLMTLALHLVDDFPQYYGNFKLPYFRYHGKTHRNHNGLLFSFEGTDGIKTGYTRDAGFNLVASVRRGGKHVIGIVLGANTSRDRNSRMRGMLRSALSIGSAAKTRVKSKPDEPAVAENVPAKKQKVLVVAKAEVASAGIVALPSLPARKKPIKTMESLISTYVGLTKAADGSPISPAEAMIMAVPASNASWSAEPAESTPAADATNDSSADGPFHVQVGSYVSRKEAMTKLGGVIKDAGNLLGGHAPVTIEFNAVNKLWYRARFAGFDQATAQSVCQSLKKQSIDCLVMRAE